MAGHDRTERTVTGVGLRELGSMSLAAHSPLLRCRWAETGRVLASAPGGTEIIGHAINNAGRVVGLFVNAGGKTHGFSILKVATRSDRLPRPRVTRLAARALPTQPTSLWGATNQRWLGSYTTRAGVE